MIDIESVKSAVFVGDGVHLSLFEQKLAEKVAAHLSGRDVEIWWCEPEAKNAVGMACINGDKALIQIKPDLSRESAFDVLLHECAHIRLHWDHLPFLGAVRMKNRTGRKANHSDEYLKAYNQREREADAQEHYWSYWASQREDTIAGKLVALLSWRGGLTNASC